MLSNDIFPTESATYSKNLTLTPLTAFSTVPSLKHVIPNAPKAGEGPYVGFRYHYSR
jgi:hypothetical protein